MFYILEWPVAELDDVRVIEMGVGGEERVLWIEIEVHCSYCVFCKYRPSRCGLQIFANLAKICFCRRFFYRTYFTDFQIFANLAKIWKGRRGRVTLPKKEIV